MSDDTLPDIPLDIEEEPAQNELDAIVEEEEGVELEIEEPVEEEIAPAPAPSEEALFELPSEKPKKKKRQLSEKQLANLAKAREKAAIKRKALAAARKKERALELAEKKAHIKQKRARKIQQQAEIEAHAEDTIMKKEQSMWDEERLVGLMNKTMDTYFEKRKAEKEKRASFPVDPSHYANYNPGMPPQRVLPKPAPPKPQPKKHRNPYSHLFGLSPEDEELYGL